MRTFTQNWECFCCLFVCFLFFYLFLLSNIFYFSAVIPQLVAFMTQFLMLSCPLANQAVVKIRSNLPTCFLMEGWKEQGELKSSFLSHHLLSAMAWKVRIWISNACLQPQSLLWEMKSCKFLLLIVILNTFWVIQLIFFVFLDVKYIAVIFIFISVSSLV